MLIAITGATGFLGRYLVRQLAGAGQRLRCWYRAQSDRSGFETESESIEWLEGQLGDVSSTHELVRGADALVHAAVQWEGPRNRGRDKKKGTS
jgi:nucleoside-diphosphate-sugar epimerase